MCSLHWIGPHANHQMKDPILSAICNCLYLQLPSISEGHLLCPQPEGVLCHGSRA